MRSCKHILGILLSLFFLSSCTPAEPGSSNSPGTPSPVGTAPGGEAQPTKAPNYLSDPKFDTKDPLPQYDHDNSWTHLLGSSTNCATEDTLYFKLTDQNHQYIGYVDLATGISGPLCGKPECLHNDEQCNAYMRMGHPGGWSIYDGKLYWIELDENWEPAVYCMNLDGTNRATVCPIDDSWFRRITGNPTFAFHRGYAIIAGKGEMVADGVAGRGVLVYAVSLSTGEATAILERSVDAETIPAIIAVPFRDMLYLAYTEETGEQRRLDISVWSLKTHETTLLYSQMTDILPEELWPTEEGILLSDGLGGGVYKFDPATGKLVLQFDGSSNGKEWYRPRFANGYVISWTLNEARIPHILATDLEGNLVYSEDLDLSNWPTQGNGYRLMGADDRNLYIWYKSAIAQIPLDGGGMVRELWSGEQPRG